MQRKYGHMQPTRQRTVIRQTVERRYGSDDKAVLASGWSHIPGYINEHRNTGCQAGYQVNCEPEKGTDATRRAQLS